MLRPITRQIAARDRRSLMRAMETAPPAALRIGVVHNPLSGNNQRGRHTLAAFARRADVVFRDSTDFASVAHALREMAAREVNAVVVSGGDGTVSAVLTAFLTASPFPRMPSLAVLRGGTSNMTAGDVGLRGPQDRALAQLIEAAAQGRAGLQTIARPVIHVDPGAGRAPLVGLFFGAAAIAQGIEYCKRHMHAAGLRGEIGIGAALTRFVVAMARNERAIAAPVPMGVAFDAAPSENFDCAVVYVTTLNRLVLGLRPFWGNEPAPLRYTAVRAAPSHWIKALPGLLRGRPGQHTTAAHGYVSRNAHRIELRLDTHAYVDGEIIEPAPGEPLTLTAAGPVHFLTLR